MILLLGLNFGRDWLREFSCRWTLHIQSWKNVMTAPPFEQKSDTSFKKNSGAVLDLLIILG